MRNLLISMGNVSQAGNGDISTDVLRAQKEARELRAQNNTLTRKGQHQQEEIRRLNKVSNDM